MESFQIEKEQTELKRKLDNINYTTNSRTLKQFGFIPTTDLSVHLNARRALGHTNPTNYFSAITNLTFHNLTQHNELPTDTHLLLGLGLKFIPTPTVNIRQADLDKTFARFERDVGLRVFFSGDEDDVSYDPSDLRGKSNWRAPILPREIEQRQTLALLNNISYGIFGKTTI